MKIKNTVQSEFCNYEDDFQKQTFISKVGIYDKDKNLLGIAKLDTNDKTIKITARVHVAFSKKSVVFLAPMIWFPAPPPNEEDNPPPLGF